MTNSLLYRTIPVTEDQALDLELQLRWFRVERDSGHGYAQALTHTAHKYRVETVATEKTVSVCVLWGRLQWLLQYPSALLQGQDESQPGEKSSIFMAMSFG